MQLDSRKRTIYQKQEDFPPSSVISLVANARPEVRLLLACARTSIDSSAVEQIRCLLRGDLDWPYILQMAREHRVMSLLYWSLHRLGSQVAPQPVLELFKEDFNICAQRGLFLTGELLKLLQLLETCGIMAIPIKGPVIAISVYGNLALRPFDDLDILIHKCDFPCAKQVLRAQRYQPLQPLDHISEVAHLRNNHDYALVRDDGVAIVELQWGVMLKPFTFLSGFERLSNQVETISLFDRSVRCFTLESQLLILCMHGSKHLWERMIWICDIAELIRTHPKLDWNWIMSEARRLGCQRMLLLGLLLAHDMLGTVLPDELLLRIRSDSVIQELAKQVFVALFCETGSPSRVAEDAPWFYFRMMERLRDKVRLLLHCYPGLFHPIRLFRIYGLAPLKHLLNI